jgi:hypothetical protein
VKRSCVGRQAGTAMAGMLVLGIVLSACSSTGGSPQAKASSSATSSTASSAPAPATADDVLHLVADASSINQLPTDIQPTLQDANHDLGGRIAQIQGCAQSLAQTSVSVSSCTYGDPTGKHTIVITGDSHSSMWIPSLDLIGKRLQWRVVALSKDSCGAPDITFWNYQAGTAYPECDAWHTWVTGEINKIDPSIVILTGEARPGMQGPTHPMTPLTWQTGMEETLNAITSPGTQKVVLGDIAYPSLNVQIPANCLAAHETNVQACSLPASKAVMTGFQTASASAAQSSGAAFIDVIPWLCSATCTVLVGNMVVYSDASHMTATYAKYLSGALEASLAPDLAAPTGH